MRSLWTKLLAAALALTMLIGVVPMMTGQITHAQAVGTYGKTTAGEVNLRLKPGGDYLFRLPDGWVCTVTDVTTSGGKTWYKVTTTDPGSTGSRVYTGYIHGDFFRMLTADEAAAWEANPVQTSSPFITAVPGYTSGNALGVLISSGVNFREGPSTRSYSMFKVDQGTVVEVLSIPETGDPDPWYRVRYNGYTGYIQGPFLKVISSGVTPTPAPVITNTPVPTATPAPGAYGYIKTIMGAVNFRRTTGGSVVDHVDKNVPFVVTGPTLRVNRYTWYPVVYKGMDGYLRNDVVKTISKQEYDELSGGATATPAPTVTPAPTNTPETPTQSPIGPTVAPTTAPTQAPSELSNHVITILPGVNLRRAATKDSTSYEQVKIGTVIEMTGTTTTGGSLWYRINYKGVALYVLGTCVRQMTVQEYNEYIGGPTATPVSKVGYVKTTATYLNVRSTANGSVVLGKIKDKGTVLEYYGTQVVGTTTWFYVSTQYGMGYVSGKYVTVYNPDVTPSPAPVGPTYTPDPVGPTYTPAPTSTTVVYPLLKLGSTGEAVKNLTAALKAQGYFSGAVTSTYTTAVRDAVKVFQYDKGLSVDGIAGQMTQEALYGANPPVDPSDITMTLYQAEKIDWFTGGIQELWPRGENLKIYDVYTGTVWWAHRWAGGSHADIEPLTADDTARLCAAYGVNNAKEIETKNLWQRRPCLVTIGNRTFACSLYGIPHGQQTIKDNNFDGQCCLHFTNSKTHDSQKVDSYHAAAIQYAWEHCPGGHK